MAGKAVQGDMLRIGILTLEAFWLSRERAGRLEAPHAFADALCVLLCPPENDEFDVAAGASMTPSIRLDSIDTSNLCQTCRYINDASDQSTIKVSQLLAS